MSTSNSEALTQSSEISKTVEDASVSNSGWFSYSSDSDIAIIFVHGFMSDSKNCWTNENGTYWPDLINKDSRVPNVSIFLGGYFTGVDSNSYGILDCSNELLSILETRQSAGYRTPLEFENIIFICHSLGGIITRYLLDSQRMRIYNKSIGLVLVASPSLGSEFADLLSGIAEFFKNRVGSQLKQNSELIRDLDNRFRSLITEMGAHNRITGIEAVETQGYLHTKFFQFLKPIVSRDSAGRYFDNPQLIARTNHSTISKPSGLEHPTHRLFVNFFDNKFSKIVQGRNSNKLFQQPSSDRNISNLIMHNASKVLFDVYDTSCKPYYFEREIDSEIAQLLKSSGVWLTGKSGAGKTSLIKHYLELNKKRPIQLSLSQLASNLSASTCIKEISETCAQLEISGCIGTPTTLSALSRVLAAHSRTSSIVLYLDEVPINGKREDEVQAFYQFVLDLMNSVKQNSEAGTKFAISSIEEPSFVASNKFKEFMGIRSVPIWTESELEKLYLLIISKIPSLHVEPNFLTHLLPQCNGAPRFLKAFLRHKSDINNPSIPDSMILQRTIQQFDW